MDRALVALLVGFLALAGTVLATVWLTYEQDRATALVRHTLEVQDRISGVQLRLEDAETGQRGYILTGRSAFLAPYTAGVERLDVDLEGLSRAVADNPRQAARAARLRAAADARLALLRENLAHFRNGEPAQAERFDRGREAMSTIRAVATEMRAEEERLLAARSEAARNQRGLVRFALLASALSVILLGWFAMLDGLRRLRAALAAGDALSAANRRLEAEAESRAIAEGQLRQVQKMEAIGQLTGGIAHDFNNMLAIIIGSLELAKRRLRKDVERADACIDNALDGAERAAKLTGRLLAFSRQQPLAPRVVEVNRLVGGMSELLRRTLGDNVKVETVLAGGLWRTFADPAQLESVLVNLCVNGRDAMPDGGRLTIETSNAHLDDAYAATHAEVAAGQYVMVSVTDSGVGMSAEVAERAFEPFYTTKGVGRGTGLGLSQVHGFVKQSAGHVKIYSEPDVGTTIKVYLPRHLGEVEAADAQQRPPVELPHGRTGEIVLVVEDDERVRHLSADALRELGYTVIQAADAGQALALLATHPRVDLLFTDVVMPDLDGRRLADRMREARPGLPVLYTTGYTRNAIVHNGVLDAEVAFLAKPFTLDQLALKVRQVLDEARTAPAD